MQTCDDGHEEIAFAGSWRDDCPACAYASEIREEMSATIEALEQEINEHECK